MSASPGSACSGPAVCQPAWLAQQWAAVYPLRMLDEPAVAPKASLSMHVISRPDSAAFDSLRLILLIRFTGRGTTHGTLTQEPRASAPRRRIEVWFEVVNSSRLARPLRCEHLEDRRLLAVVTVDTPLDVIDFNDGKTSLREAIFATNTVPGADEIRFDFGHDGPETILLTQGELAITDSLTITGPGAELLTIDASGIRGAPIVDFRCAFTVDDGGDSLIDVAI